MAVKVSKVLDRNTGKPITVDDCEKGYEGNYICHTGSCGADMSFVPSFEKRLLDKNHAEKIIVVPSFFRLQRNQHHLENCPFDTKSAITIIARSSDSNVLKAIDEGKYEFNLQILHKPKKDDGEASSSFTKSTTAGSSNTGKIYKNSGTATSYIKTLNQILALRAKLESNSELAQHIKLTYQGMKIPWDDFYFETERYIDACRILNKVTTEYPMCFHGRVKAVSKLDHLKFPIVKLFSPFRDAYNGIKEIPTMDINVADANFDISTLPENSEILIYGKVNYSPAENLWSPPNKTDSEKIQFINMNIWVNHIRQLVVL